jgi:glycosyltransferase involved in cell wall biosynthesis
MKVLLVHNRYRTSAPSGEDIAVGNEYRMLQAHGVDVDLFERCNDDVDASTLMAKASAAVNTVWSRRARRDLRQVLQNRRPDVVHVHNTFSLISPSVYGACKSLGIPVVQTLHNFRFFCPAALFLRDGKPCEECLDRSLLQSIKHRCYRGSFAATATLASMLTVHRIAGTYANDIDRYISLTEFGRGKALKAGIPRKKLVVKPNFLANPPTPGKGGGGYVAYVGRLLEGKGVETLVTAWQHLSAVKLKIVGDGALRPKLEALARRDNLNVEFAGLQDKSTVLQVIADAEFLIVPSECYEGFPMVIAESFACGTPVLASRIGSMEELIEEDVTGKKFTAGNPTDLAAVVRSLVSNKALLQGMRSNTRAYFDKHLTEASNFRQLTAVYSEVIADTRRAKCTG